MDITEIRQRILTDDGFVLEEVQKLQYLHQLKTVIRSNLKRAEDVQTESVAEHIYTMLILADYFSRIEEFYTPLNMQRVFELITWHDIDEIETGDVVGFLKTADDRAKEVEAQAKIVIEAPIILRNEIKNALAEYKAQETPEAQFAKAIDKIDPVFMLLNPNGKKLVAMSPINEDQHTRIKIPYIKDYPYIKRFFEVTRDKLKNSGYFAEV